MTDGRAQPPRAGTRCTHKRSGTRVIIEQGDWSYDHAQAAWVVVVACPAHGTRWLECQRSLTPIDTDGGAP